MEKTGHGLSEPAGSLLKPGGLFEFEDGNGVYDVPTRADFERWELERALKQKLEKNEVPF